MSAPAKPRPDFGGERNQRERILELERPFGGLVPKHNHAKQTAGPATECTKHGEKRFRDAAAGLRCAPFVEAEDEECHRAECGEPDGGK